MDIHMNPDYAQIEPFVPLAQAILTALAVLVFGWMASKWALRITLSVLRNRKVDEAVSQFLANFAQYAVLAVTALSALEAVGIQTARFNSAIRSTSQGKRV